jgi:hypothetical protein
MIIMLIWFGLIVYITVDLYLENVRSFGLLAFGTMDHGSPHRKQSS